MSRQRARFGNEGTARSLSSPKDKISSNTSEEVSVQLRVARNPRARKLDPAGNTVESFLLISKAFFIADWFLLSITVPLFSGGRESSDAKVSNCYQTRPKCRDFFFLFTFFLKQAKSFEEPKSMCLDCFVESDRSTDE